MRFLTLLATVAVAAAPAASIHAQNPNPWVWRGTVAQGRTLEVRGLIGSIRAERASGTDVEVTAVKTGGDVNAVRVAVVRDEVGNVTICPVYPGGPDDCAFTSRRMNLSDSPRISVAFTVRVPAGVAFVGFGGTGDVIATGLDGPVALSSLSGNVTASGLTGRVAVTTLSGDAAVETASGDATATTLSGQLRVTIRGRSQRPLHFASASGNITLSLPRDVGADVEFSTLGGELTCDLPFTSNAGFWPRGRAARIGDGGRQLLFSTVTGSVRIQPLP